MNIINYRKAFTFLEMIIVIGITGLLVAAASPVYGSFQVKLQLLDSSAEIVQILRTARQQSLVGYNNANHGVFFDIDSSGADSFTLYQGASYASRDQDYDLVFNLKNSLLVANGTFTLTGNDIDINFAKGGLGLPDNIGNLTLTHSVTGSKTITVNRYGMVEKN